MKTGNIIRIVWLVFWFTIALVTTGCHAQLLKGLIYTRVKTPLTKNLNHTPCKTPSGSNGNIVIIKEPFSGYGMYTEIYSNAIGDIAKKNGLKKVYFADQEIYSILGIWTSSTIYVYGE
ncbi:MAG: TRL domain-containing protein [Desulfobacterales bacterium]